jgi:hypothetical protein
MSQSVRRKAKRKMYKRLKREGRLIKPQTKSTVPLPQLTSLSTLRNTPKIKKALARVCEFETNKPGQFAKWLEDLHIEHFRAGFQERLDEIARRKNEQDKENQNSEKQTAAQSETHRPE